MRSATAWIAAGRLLQCPGHSTLWSLVGKPDGYRLLVSLMSSGGGEYLYYLRERTGPYEGKEEL